MRFAKTAALIVAACGLMLLGGCKADVALGSFSVSDPMGIAASDLTRAADASVRQLGTDTIESVLWTSRQSKWTLSGRKGLVTGTARLGDGSRIDIAALFTSAGKGWQLASVEALGPRRSPPAAVKPKAPGAEMPSQAERNSLVFATANGFLAGLKAKTMTRLHNDASARLRQSVSVAEMDRSFAKMIGSVTVTGNPLIGRKPVFASATLERQDGPLWLKGYYDLGKSRMAFEFAYVREASRWKLAAIRAEFRNVAGPPKA